MTFLEIVNTVLLKLREPEVTTVSENTLSKLIGLFVNETKREVEDSYNWNRLSTTIEINTSAGVGSYVLTGSGQRFKVEEFVNDTQDTFMCAITSKEMTQFLLLAPSQQGAPYYYTFNGVDSNGDTKVDMYPVPDKLYNIKVNCVVPQPRLTADSTELLVSSDAVIQGAFAKALIERGEDGGVGSSEAHAQYRFILSDLIALEESRHPGETDWMAV